MFLWAMFSQVREWGGWMAERMREECYRRGWGVEVLEHREERNPFRAPSGRGAMG